MSKLRKVALGIAASLLLGVALLALPVRSWRTGETPVPPLSLVAGDAFAALPMRVWIDADPACGTGARRDPDDCLALLALLEDPRVEVAGVSTVFGNAPAAVTAQVAKELLDRINRRRATPVPLFHGSAQALDEDPASPAQPAHRAIRGALAQGPLTFVALGPLTNLAAAVAAEPALERNLAAIVAVMGRRPGHLFHPAEGRSPGALLFGHGPVFSDLNLAADPRAAAQIVGGRTPLVLIPYEAARQVEIDAASLDAIAARSDAARWVAERSRDWLGFWQRDIGRPGFYPFDLMAAAYLLDPAQFRCARAAAWVGRDSLLGPFGRRPALLVGPAGEPGAAPARAIYCSHVAGELSRPWRVARASA